MLIVYLSDWLLCGVRCLAVSPNFEIAKNNMAIALTDLGTKVVFLALLWSKCSYPFYSCSYSTLMSDWRRLL